MGMNLSLSGSQQNYRIRNLKNTKIDSLLNDRNLDRSNNLLKDKSIDKFGNEKKFFLTMRNAPNVFNKDMRKVSMLTKVKSNAHLKTSTSDPKIKVPDASKTYQSALKTDIT